MTILLGFNRHDHDGGVLTANDYYPGGMQMPARSYSIANTNYRYGFNGKEKSSEVNVEGSSYDYGARTYDSRLVRWHSTDELEKKYPSFSPYVFALNSPNRIIDVDGKDIIILSAPSGAGGFGHAAVLIGNDKFGWTLYSKNGTFGSSGTISSGPDNNNPEAGIYVGSLSEFANSERNFHHGRVQYPLAFKITSSAEIDTKMKAAALKQVNTWYDVTGTTSGSCIDVPSDALVAGGFESGKKGETEGGSYLGRGQILEGALKPIGPNERFKNIVKQNKGTDVTSQILPTEESMAKYKKENDVLEILKTIEKENQPTIWDKVGKAWDKFKNTINDGIKEAERRLTPTSH